MLLPSSDLPPGFKWPMKRYLFPVLLLVLAGLGLAVAARPTRPRLLARVEGKVLTPPTGQDGWIAWLEENGGEARLVVTRKRESHPRVALAGVGLSGLAVVENFAFLTTTGEAETGGPRARLLRVDLRDGKSETLALLAKPADQLTCGGGWLCWRETREAALPGVPFVAAGAPLTVIRASPEDGKRSHIVATVLGQGSDSGNQVELLGIAAGYAYWLQRVQGGLVGSTLIQRAELPDGSPEAVTREPGRRTAALTEGALLWTAPSLEAAEPNHFSAVKRRALEGSDIQVIADWLTSDAVVLTSRTDAYVQERNRLCRLGGQRGQQHVQYKGPPRVLTARLLDDEEYLVMRSGGSLLVAKRPLTLRARVRNLLWR